MTLTAEPKAVFDSLSKTDSYKQWVEQHPKGFLTHFFCQLDQECNLKSEWEVGFFEPSIGKITVFVPLSNGDSEIKPADDVFKKDTTEVEKLNWKEVKLSFEDAIKIWKENLPQQFPHETIGDGFIILQTFQEQTVWNFTFITKALRFINLKIFAADGKVASHQTINLVQGKE